MKKVVLLFEQVARIVIRLGHLVGDLEQFRVLIMYSDGERTGNRCSTSTKISAAKYRKPKSTPPPPPPPPCRISVSGLDIGLHVPLALWKIEYRITHEFFCYTRAIHSCTHVIHARCMDTIYAAFCITIEYTCSITYV